MRLTFLDVRSSEIDTLEPFSILRRSINASLSYLRTNLTIMLRGLLGFRPLTPTRWATQYQFRPPAYHITLRSLRQQLRRVLTTQAFFGHSIHAN